MTRHSTSTSRSSLKEAIWGDERPFYWLLTIVMIFIYGTAVTTLHLLQDPVRFALLTVLMVAHTVLHWQVAVLVRERRRWIPWYMVGQGALALTIGSLAPGVGLILGLYMALIGESFGLLYKTRWVMVAVGGYLILSALNFLETAQWRDLIWWVIAMAPMTLFVSIYVYLYSRQTDARSKAQALSRELEAANRQLTEYAARVADLTRTAERQRMARELHDTLAQGLAGLILQLEAADSHLQSGKPERAQAIIEQSMARARATLADARRAIDDLRSESAAPANLAEAVQTEVSRFMAATGLPCELDLALPGALPVAIGEQAFRAVAEGLTNIAKHAQASRAWVRVRGEGTGLTVQIRDDGRGFDCATAGGPGHYGLLGMRERARLAHGTFDLASTPGAGTTLKLCLPVSAVSEAPAAVQDGTRP